MNCLSPAGSATVQPTTEGPPAEEPDKSAEEPGESLEEPDKSAEPDGPEETIPGSPFLSGPEPNENDSWSHLHNLDLPSHCRNSLSA